MARTEVAPRVSWRGEAGRTGSHLLGRPPSSLGPQCHPLCPTPPAFSSHAFVRTTATPALGAREAQAHRGHHGGRHAGRSGAGAPGHWAQGGRSGQRQAWARTAWCAPASGSPPRNAPLLPSHPFPALPAWSGNRLGAGRGAQAEAPGQPGPGPEQGCCLCTQARVHLQARRAGLSARWALAMPGPWVPDHTKAGHCP